MVKEIKSILGIEGHENSAMLKWIIKDCTRAVLDYCHIKELPKELESFVIGLVINEFNIQNEGSIESIKRGDTTVSYNTNISSTSFTDKQKLRLNRYRRIRLI